LCGDIVYEPKWVLYKKAVGKMYETKLILGRNDFGTKWWGTKWSGQNERGTKWMGRNERDEM
jgi:hypothetical protein